MTNASDVTEQGREGQGTLRGHLLALGLFAVLTAAMLYPYPLEAGTHLRNLGDPLEFTWVLGYSAHQLVTSPLHLYDANIFYPFRQSLAFGESMIGNSLVALPIVLLTDNPVLAQNLIILMSFVLAGFGAYLLVWDLTGSRAAGILAGVIFAFCPYRMDRLWHVSLVAAHWLPFAFFSLNRFLARRTWRWAVAFGGFTLLQCLSTTILAYITGLALLVYLFCLLCWRPRQVLRRDTLLPLLAAGVGVAAVLAIVYLPYLEVSERFGMRRLLDEAEDFSASLESYVAVPSFNRTWGRVQSLVALGRLERQMFPGLLAAALAVVGLVKGRSGGHRVAFALTGLSAFAITLGPSLRVTVDGPAVDLPFPLPFRVLYTYLPGFDSMRVPARFAIVVMLAIAALAGLGAAYLLRKAAGQPGSGRSAWRRRLHAGLATLLVAIALFEYVSVPFSLEPVPTGAAIPEVYQWLRDQPDKQVIVELPIAVEVFHESPYIYYSTYHHWTLVNGWRSFTPPGYSELVAALASFPSAESVQLLANLKVKYVVVHADKLPRLKLPAGSALLQPYAEALRLVRQFGDDYVYELSAPTRPPESLALSLVAPCVVEAGESYRAHLIYDAPGRPVVAVPDPPARLTIRTEWSAESGARLDQEVGAEPPDALIKSGLAQPIRLQAPAVPGTYRLTVRVSPKLAASQADPPPRTVTVLPPGTRGQMAPPRAVSAELPAKAASVGEPVPLVVAWQAECPDDVARSTFVNIYDSRYVVWSAGSRTAPDSSGAGTTAGRSGPATDRREVLLRPDTPSGYYSVEFGILDPVTGQRRQFLDPGGRLVDKVTLGPLRVVGRDVLEAVRGLPEHPVRAQLGDGIELLGWAGAETARPGATVPVALRWQAVKPQATSYNVFVHLYDAAGRLVAQRDGAPGGGAWPTSAWQVGDAVQDVYQLAVPADLKPGEYTLAVGMYDLASLRRLPVSADAASVLPDDRVLLVKLRVE